MGKVTNCGEGAPQSWDEAKKVECCLKENKGCPTTSTSPCPIDCNAGYNDLDPMQWVRGWSGEKKLYCCKTANRGCPAELPPPSGLPPSGLPPAPDTNVYVAMLGTTTACTVWWSLGLHRRSITAARTSTRVARARSRSEQAAGVRSRIEAAPDMYVQK